MKKLFTLFLLACCSLSIWAYQFKHGDLCYNVLSYYPNTVEVTYSTADVVDPYNYVGLDSVVVPDSVVYNEMTFAVVGLGDRAFNTTSIVNISLPNTIEYIGEHCFDWADKLVFIAIPNSVKHIRRNAFACCESLQSVLVGDSVETIDMAAFMGCRSLETIHLPKSVYAVGPVVFSHTDKLQSFSVDEDNLRYCAVDGVLYDKDKKTIVAYPCGRQDEKYTILEGVEEVYYSAFESNMYLKEVKLPTSLNIVGPYAFSMCQELRYVDIPNNVTEIDEWAFANCQKMDSIRFGTSLESIDWCAFVGCFELRVIDCCLTAPCWVGSQGLDTGYDDYYGINTTLLVPKGTKDLFAVAAEWRDLNIVEKDSEVTTDIVNTSINQLDGTMKVINNVQLNILHNGKSYNLQGARLQ